MQVADRVSNMRDMLRASCDTITAAAARRHRARFQQEDFWRKNPSSKNRSTEDITLALRDDLFFNLQRKSAFPDL